MRARLRRRDTQETEEAGRRLEMELEALRALTEAATSRAEGAVDRIDKIVKEPRA